MKWIKVITINVLLLVAFLIIIEGVIYLFPLKYKILPPLEPRGYSIYDPEIGYDITPNFATSTHSFFDTSYPVWSNELGCFDMPFTKEGPYVYLTGDSFAWGWAPFEDKWGTVVEKELGMRVLKCGVNGYGTKQELLKAKKILSGISKPPSLIIVGYLGANDIEDDELFPNYTVGNGYRVRSSTLNRKQGLLVNIKQWMSANVVLYNLAKSKVYAPALAFVRNGNDPWVTTPVSKEDAYEKHKENILGFKSFAKEKGSQVIFVLIPGKEEVALGYTLFNDKLKPFFEENGIAYVDLLPGLVSAYKEGKELYWNYDGHWNLLGNDLAGKEVSRYILEKGLLLKGEERI